MYFILYFGWVHCTVESMEEAPVNNCNDYNYQNQKGLDQYEWSSWEPSGISKLDIHQKVRYFLEI